MTILGNLFKLSFGNKEISVQNPLPANGSSVYCQDLNLPLCDIGSFVGDICTLFDDYYSNNVAASTESGGVNPKFFTLAFNRPILGSTIGVGSPNTSASNGKLTLYGLDGNALKVVDLSSDNDKKGILYFQFEQIIFIKAKIEFLTDDEVTLGGCGITKSSNVSIDAINGVISNDNSSKTPLLADGIFTGGIIDTKNYGIIICSAYSDVASAVDGLIIEFSTDMINWRWNDVYDIGAGKAKTFSVQTQARFMRIRYINGGSDQTVFDLETTLKPVYIKPSSHRVADPISGQDDAELVKAVITGENPAGLFVNFQSTSQGNFKVSLEELENNISVDSNTKLNTAPYVINEYGVYSQILGDTIFEGAQIAIDVAHHEIHCGDSYMNTRAIDLGNAGVDTIIINVPNEAVKLYHMLINWDHEAEAEINIYEGATTGADGILIPNYNRNRNSSNLSDLGVYHTPTTPAGGTLIYTLHVGTGRTEGGANRGDHEIILKNNTKYRITITNAVTTNNYISWNLNHYIHPGI